MRKFTLFLSSLTPLTLSTSALAHPFHATNVANANFMTAFTHPFFGVDHLIVMLFMGALVAASNKGRAVSAATLLGSLTLGFVVGQTLTNGAAIENVVMLSIGAIPLMILARKHLELAIQCALIALFALSHGLVQGIEVSAVSLSALVEVSAGTLLGNGTIAAIGFGMVYVLSLTFGKARTA